MKQPSELEMNELVVVAKRSATDATAMSIEEMLFIIAHKITEPLQA
jgi:hypothetical protein